MYNVVIDHNRLLSTFNKLNIIKKINIIIKNFLINIYNK